MFQMNYLLYFILLQLVTSTPQVNLYYTDWINESTSNRTLQYNCLHVPVEVLEVMQYREIAFFCMSQSPSKFNATDSGRFPKFTFLQLARQNVTSEDLYRWSASIDLIEQYQFYLNQYATSSGSLLAKEVFYNCTLPRFGPICQYELDFYRPHYSSLYDMVYRFYSDDYNPFSSFGCYIHLQCNFGLSPLCLDWREICDGKIDCLDGGSDEEHCWQLEINQCKEDEYRCINGQCIPNVFYQSDNYESYCLDGTDRRVFPKIGSKPCVRRMPSLQCDDLLCESVYRADLCLSDHRITFWKEMYSISDSSMSENCSSALKCTFGVHQSEISFCQNLCANNACIGIIENTCPEMFFFPNVPVLFDDVYFAYRKNDLRYLIASDNRFPYICLNSSRYDPFFNTTSSIIFNNTACFLSQNLGVPSYWSPSWALLDLESLKNLYRELKKYHFAFHYNSTICNRSNMYQCINSSKCVAVHRLLDSVYDCPFMDDENYTVIANTNVERQLKQTHYKCQLSNKYIHQSLIEDLICHCQQSSFLWCEDENLNYLQIRNNILFQFICDGSVELIPININEQNETDETECQHWECHNIYTHCDGMWNCPNGADEIGCFMLSSELPIDCSSNHRICVSPQTNQFICLPNEKANDGKVDCLGGTDELILCPWTVSLNGRLFTYSCISQTSESCIDDKRLCDGYEDCEHGDDEQFCNRSQAILEKHSICSSYFAKTRSDVEAFLCARSDLRPAVPLILIRHGFENSPKNIKINTRLSNALIADISDQRKSLHYRGLKLFVWLNDTSGLKAITYLCPVSYYGDQCQYQNQRVALTISFQAFSDAWQTHFAIIISLIDDSDQRTIHSFEQFSYLWIKNCQSKFNIYLLYSIRPKDLTKNYSIHIDFYEKLSKLVYWGSSLLPVQFPFLPIQRLAFFVDIPRTNDRAQSCSNDQCIHGECIRYSSHPQNLTFCQCHPKWSGRYCNISYICTCSSDSLCLGITAHNRSVCICPLNKFGPRCLINDTIYQDKENSTCENRGRRILNDGYMLLDQKFACICPKGYSGDQCEIVDNKLILSFSKDIAFSQTLLIHFIEIRHIAKKLVRLSTFRWISRRQDSVTIYWSQPFHFVFTEPSNKHYYLTVLQETHEQSAVINKTIHSTDRCRNISELFNQTFLQWHLIRRIKYYHLPCQQQSLNLSCFYDDVHMCLCYNFKGKRLSNCFNFDHNLTFDCFGQSECENDGQCFQNNRDCPTRSMCVCRSCFYGQRCQFSTSGFVVSLDAILGYQVLPNVSLTQQPAIVQFAFSFTLIFMVAGLIDGTLCLITFKNKPVREVGCGLYLFGSAVTTLLTMVIFELKFLILLLTQMTIISNKSFLQVQCVSLDFLLRICLLMDQWLNACVAVERAITTMKGAQFNKKKSKQAVKFVISILLLIIVGSCIHDPLNRHLIDEGNEDDDMKRTWCIVRYSYTLQFYNSYMYTFHFCVPFLINLISSIILILMKSRQQSIIHKQRLYKEILREQCQLHKHLLTAPLVLVILGLPRLIIASVSKCMKSSDDAWLFLIGYLVSFLPSVLTFVIFIVPSEFYKREFHKSMIQIRTTIQRCLNLIS